MQVGTSDSEVTSKDKLKVNIVHSYVSYVFPTKTDIGPAEWSLRMKDTHP